jgi:hypothetical protein
MFKMGSHDPFKHFKHKLWPKEGLGVKLAIWLPTTKSRESPWFPRVQVACDISLKSSWRELQLWFRPHLNQRSTHKVMGPQNHKNLSCENFETHLGVPKQNVIWVSVPWLGTKYTIRGKVVLSFKSGLWWVLWVRVYPWLILAPKVLHYALTNLLFGFV